MYDDFLLDFYGSNKIHYSIALERYEMNRVHMVKRSNGRGIKLPEMTKFDQAIKIFRISSSSWFE